MQQTMNQHSLWICIITIVTSLIQCIYCFRQMSIFFKGRQVVDYRTFNNNMTVIIEFIIIGIKHRAIQVVWIVYVIYSYVKKTCFWIVSPKTHFFLFFYWKADVFWLVVLCNLFPNLKYICRQKFYVLNLMYKNQSVNIFINNSKFKSLILMNKFDEYMNWLMF